MKPSCKGCGQEIVWEGFDFTIHEHLCGICLRQLREGVRRERERIIALLENISFLEDYPPFNYTIVTKEALALIKGENE